MTIQARSKDENVDSRMMVTRVMVTRVMVTRMTIIPKDGNDEDGDDEDDTPVPATWCRLVPQYVCRWRGPRAGSWGGEAG